MAASSAPPDVSRGYLCQFAKCWFSWRMKELRAAADNAGVDLIIDAAEEAALEARSDGVLLRIHLADEASVRQLASRAVLCKNIIEEWGSGRTWDELAAALRAYPTERSVPYLAAGTSFKVNVTSLGRRLVDKERLKLIADLDPLLACEGIVDLKTPDHVFVLFVDTPEDSSLVSALDCH